MSVGILPAMETKSAIILGAKLHPEYFTVAGFMLRRHSYIMNEYLVLDIVREQRLARAIKPYIK